MSSWTGQCGGGGETHRHSPLAGGQSQSQGDVSLAGAALPMAMTFSLRSMYSHRASCMTSGLFSDGMARKSKVSMAGKRAARMRRCTMRWWRSMVPVRRAQQIVRVSGLRRRTGWPACGRRKVGSFSSLRWCSRSSVDRVLSYPPRQEAHVPWRGWSARDPGQVGIQVKIEARWAFDAAQPDASRREADGAQPEGVLDGVVDLLMGEVLQQTQHLHEFALAPFAHASLQQTPQRLSGSSHPCSGAPDPGRPSSAPTAAGSGWGRRQSRPARRSGDAGRCSAPQLITTWVAPTSTSRCP